MSLVGIVAVSHSRPLAEAAVELASQMIHGDAPRIVVAAGTADGGLGTDATVIADAIAEADQGAGVLVLTDLGSAVMSAEMAAEFAFETEVRIAPAPFVEGLIAAAVQASIGASLDQVLAEATGALAAKQPETVEPSPAADAPAANTSTQTAHDPHTSPTHPDATAREPQPELTREVQVINPAGLHARPAAQLVETVSHFDVEMRVTGPSGRTAPTHSAIQLTALRASLHDVLTLTATGPDAQAALDAAAELFAAGFGELEAASDDHVAPQDTPGHAEPPTQPGKPLGVSPGRVVGPAYSLGAAHRECPPADAPADSPDHPASLREAIDAVTAEYRARAGATSSSDARDILNATATLASDPALYDLAIEKMRAQSLGAAAALWLACDEVAEQFQQAGGRIAERTQDVHDIRNRILNHLLGEPAQGIPNPGEPFVLLAEELSPTDAAALRADACIAIVTRAGGPTSHTSILARSLGIPAVVGFDDVATIPDATVVLVDGTTGDVVVDPSDAERATASSRPSSIAPLPGPGGLGSGEAISLQANVGTLAGAQVAQRAQAEGIGLFRTEFCFLEQQTEPSVEEQIQRYSEILECFRGKPITIRTLDAGSDKPMPFLTMPNEENPALGVRGYRTALAQPDVLKRQLEAIVAASEQTGIPASVMAPMISTPAEAHDFAALARELGVRQVGVMIETPSAALLADEIMAVVDFCSIGTNDLSQYVMAADRLATPLGYLLDIWQPALLRMVQKVGAAAQRHNKPAGVCGEAGSDPLLAPVLVGLGIRSLSMTPHSLAPVATRLAELSLADCERAAAAACAAASPEEARTAVVACLPQAQ